MILKIVNLLVPQDAEDEEEFISFSVFFFLSLNEKICDRSLTDRCFTTAYTWAIPNVGSYRPMIFTAQF